MSVDFDVRVLNEMDFFTGGSVIMDYGLIFWPDISLKLKHLNDLFISYKHAYFHFTRC